MTDKSEKEKSYYPGGKLWSERSYKQGVPHGRHREWHENGVLASEVHLKDGIPDGVGRQWDEKGDLIVEYEIKNGTGIQKVWIANQGIWGEISWVNGTRTGRLRACLEDGTVVADTFWIRNEKVSKKRYMEACKVDANLPRYVEPRDSKEKTKKRERSINAGEAKQKRKCYIVEDSFVAKILASKDTREGLSWLTESNVPERSLGEAQGREASIELVKSIYQLGAKCVWVFDIDGELTEEQNSGRLIVELPEGQNERQAILAQCAEIGAEQGFDVEPDTGQRYTLLMLD